MAQSPDKRGEELSIQPPGFDPNQGSGVMTLAVVIVAVMAAWGVLVLLFQA